MDGILPWTKLHVSNSTLEGTNNKVNVVNHRAYGFRKANPHITAIWHGCGNLTLEQSQ